MEREEGLLDLHTDRFLLFLCVLRLNPNRPTCPFNTSVLLFSPFLSLSCVCPLFPLYTSVPCTQGNHHKPLSHHLCIASSIPLPICPAPSLHTLLCTVCVCVCVTHPEAPFCTDIGMLWTLALNSLASCGFSASPFSLQHLHINVCTEGIMQV